MYIIVYNKISQKIIILSMSMSLWDYDSVYLPMYWAHRSIEL